MSQETMIYKGIPEQNFYKAQINFAELYASVASLQGGTSLIPISDKAANFDITATEARGTRFICSTAAAGSLPTPLVAGMNGSIEAGQGVTAILQLVPPAGAYIVVDGVRGTVATALASAGAAGDRIEWWAVSATDIHVRTVGTWAE